MDELTLMKAAAAATAATQPTPQASAEAGDQSLLARVLKERQEFLGGEAMAEKVEAARPIEPVAPAEVTYRDPTTGEVKTTTVTMRVLLRTDERMTLWQLALSILGMRWDASPVASREEAYAQAVCRIQWDAAADVPDWFKRAYVDDSEFALSLTEEVTNFTDAYFRGLDGKGNVVAAKRFVVKRTGGASA